MNQQLLNRLSVQALRQLMLQHMKKFCYGIEIGSTLSDLEEMRAEIKEIAEVLMKKETEEKNVEKNTQLYNSAQALSDQNLAS